MAVKVLTDQGPDGFEIGLTSADTGTIYATTTVASGGSVNFASGSALKIGGVTVAPTGTSINLLMAGVTAGQKIARGTAAVTTSLEVATGLATVVAGVATLQDDPNVTASHVTVAASTTAGNILLKTWQPTATNNVTPTAATKTNVAINWLAIGT